MSDDWKNLGVEVRARRKELKLTQAELASRGGPSEALVRELETGRYKADMQDAMRAGLERSLEWIPGSIAAILAGGKPVDIKDDEEHRSRHTHALRDELLQDVEAALERFRSAASGLVSAEARVDGAIRIWALSELMRQKVESLIATNPRYGTGYATTSEEAEKVIASLPRPTPAEMAEFIAIAATTDTREWTRYEMAVVEAVYPDYPQDVTRGSLYADLEPFRERVRRLGPTLTAGEPETRPNLNAAAKTGEVEPSGEFE